MTSPGTNPMDQTVENDVAAFAIFAYAPTGQQVSVTASPSFSNTLMLAYDNTNGYNYGVALVDSNLYNYVGQPNDTINVKIVDQAGNQIATDSFQIAPAGHLTFVLADRYPAIANTRGAVTFTMSEFGSVAGLGLRYAPWGALTSVDMFEPATY